MDITINGEEGLLQAGYHKNEEKNKKIAVILSDHPKRGSHMNDKAIYTLYHTYTLQGFNVIRFNYRGVGLSKGEFSGNEGEITDAANILDWMEKTNDKYEEVHVVGIGFGSWLALHLLMRRPEITNFALISPIVEGYEFNFVNPCAANGIIVKTECQKESQKEKIKKLYKDLEKMNSGETKLIRMNTCCCKFESKLKPLFDNMQEFITKK
ncbi:MAG: alpha/beta hydrolase [Alphaproteobacteria bacterium]|jgi:alpha/beta superfamily hydrolase|nr:alpha/beta hydrolase [Alphaproteobacteria bacterium]